MNLKISFRLKQISFNTLRQGTISLFGIVTSIIVVNFSSKALWGEFVYFLLYILFSQQIINWGNREYLIRFFSENPYKIKEVFTSIFFVRFPLLFFFLIIDVSFFNTNLCIYLFLWQLGLFLTNSYEAIVIYEKKFIRSIYIEILSFIFFIISFFIWSKHLRIKQLLIIYSLYQIARGLLYFATFRNNFHFKKQQLDFYFYKKNIWFFFLSFLGFFVSKVDVYIIESFNNRVLTTDYQIMNTFFIFIMSIPMYIFNPFIKNIYRNNTSVILKFKKNIILIGLIIIPLCLICVCLLQVLFLQNNFHFKTYILAFFYIIPSFIYGIEILQLFRQHKEKKVVIILFIGALLTSTLTFLFLKNNLEFDNALLGSTIAQILLLFLFSVTQKK